MGARGEDRRRELKEQAIAARAAQSTQEGFKHFMDVLDKKDSDAAQDEFVERVVKKKPSSTLSEDDIEWQKSS